MGWQRQAKTPGFKWHFQCVGSRRTNFEIEDRFSRDGRDIGEFRVLGGPSGCGQSTVQHLIAGFDRPDNGETKGYRASRHDRKQSGMIALKSSYRADKQALDSANSCLVIWILISVTLPWASCMRRTVGGSLSALMTTWYRLCS